MHKWVLLLYSGSRVVTRHYRANADPEDPDEYVEFPYMNWDNHYSTHYQEIRQLKLPRRIMPGDVLLTTCEFKTTDRVNATLGGFAISEEMCVNYVHYYPKSKLEVCKSSVSMKALREYFHFMAKMEGQKIIPEGPISSAYKGIEWSPFRAKLLSDFYNQSPVDMQCNQSDGSRFPGSWDEMSQPPFQPLPPAQDPNEQCYLDFQQQRPEKEQRVSTEGNGNENQDEWVMDEPASNLQSQIFGNAKTKSRALVNPQREQNDHSHVHAHNGEECC